MPWWGWMILGAMLLGAELGLVDTGFYLVFLGVAALAVGLLDLTADLGEAWVEWLVFAGIAAASLVLFRQRVYALIKGPGEGYDRGLEGQELKLLGALAPGDTCRLEFRGSTWTVTNEGPDTIPAGGKATIRRVDGLTLRVSATAAPGH